LWGAGAGGQDRAHVSGTETPERHRTAQGADQRLFAVGGTQPEQDVEFLGQPRVADGGCTDQKLLGFLAESAELFLGNRFRSWPA